MSAEVQGRRLPDGSMPERPGDYVRVIDGQGVTHWFNWPPGAANPGELRRFDQAGDSGMFHEVEEHDDGTITVRPSILHHDRVRGMQAPGGAIIGPDGWHGFLERGVWREV